MDLADTGVEFSKRDDDLTVYSFDATGVKGRAMGVVWPRNSEEVSKVLKYCHDHKVPVTPRGAGTSLSAGATPQESLVLDLSKMNRILDVGGDFAVVEAGVVIDDLNDELKKHGKVFPVKPASSSVCQIGGAISTNAAGERAVKYGKMERWVESVEVVFATGRTSWEKPDDFVGTEGLMGVVTKAKLKIVEPPGQYSATHRVFDSMEEMFSYIDVLEDVLSVEFINPIAADIMGLEKGNHLIVEFESDEGEMNFEEAMGLIKIREKAGPSLTSEGFPVMEDPLIPREKMPEFLDWLERNGIPAFGHVAFGIIHPRFEQDSKKVDDMFEVVEKLGGTASGEHGIGMTKKRFLKPSERKRLKKMKKRYDYYNILNRGKVI